jgi:hypothetical protein
MSARTFVLFSSITLSCLASFACSSDGNGTEGTGGSPGSGGSQQGSGGGGGAENPTCKVSVNASAAPLSFKDDVMPIFGFACAGSSCHSGSRPKADLFLGPKCDYSNGDCIWPDQPNTDNPAAGQPITQADIDKVHSQLLASSLTASAAKRVVPSDPDASFLVDKIAGIQNDKGLTCTNTETNAEVGPCGQWMPYTGGPLCGRGSASGQARVDTIVNWIAQGAKNN